MQNTYDFTIEYEGKKKKQFIPGPLSQNTMELLRSDLTSLGVNLPKRENVSIRRQGVVSITFLQDIKVSDTNIQL